MKSESFSSDLGSSGEAATGAARIVGPTLMVPTGGGAVMSVSLPNTDPHLEWSLRYGNPEAVRFSAASVIESFDYLLSDNINMTEATRRLRVLRAAVRTPPGSQADTEG